MEAYGAHTVFSSTPQQALAAAEMKKMVIRVVADDIDIFILLLHVYFCQKLTRDFIMSGTSYGRSCVSIKFTTLAHSNILTHSLPAYILPGCDAVSLIWGIGKSTVVKVLKSESALHKLGRIQESVTEVISEATKFISACYGFAGETNITNLRFKVWSNKMEKCKVNSAPDLRALPQTSKVFEDHVHQTHFQTAIWRTFADAEPPKENPSHFGWTLDAHQNQLMPIALPSDVAPAPEQILKMIKRECTTCVTNT